MDKLAKDFVDKTQQVFEIDEKLKQLDSQKEQYKKEYEHNPNDKQLGTKIAQLKKEYEQLLVQSELLKTSISKIKK